VGPRDLSQRGWLVGSVYSLSCRLGLWRPGKGGLYVSRRVCLRVHEVEHSVRMLFTAYPYRCSFLAKPATCEMRVGCL
jgi:hypothetical protein